MSTMIAPLFGYGRGESFRRPARQFDAFGTNDFDRYADGQVRCQAVIDFLSGKRAEPEFSSAEYAEAMAAVAARRGA